MAENTPGENGSEGTAAPKKKRRGKKGKKAKSGGGKKIMLFVVAPLLLILIGGGVSFAMGWLDSLLGIKKGNQEAVLALGKPVFVELPEIRTDMKTGACRSPFLRAVVQVQLSADDSQKLEDNKDFVMDGILTHLRDQERQNVVGKEGSERLRFELVQIIENRIQPAKVHTVLFKELVLQ